MATLVIVIIVVLLLVMAVGGVVFTLILCFRRKPSLEELEEATQAKKIQSKLNEAYGVAVGVRREETMDRDRLNLSRNEAYAVTPATP